MEENLAEALLKTADVLHWLGKYQVANALILFSRFCRARKLDTLEALEAVVVTAERT